MKPSSGSEYKRNQLARYQILMQHRQHVERIFWSRIQILHLIQAAVIGGIFYIYKAELPTCFYFVLLGLGIILTVLLLILCIYDWKSAEVNKERLYSLGDALSITWSGKRWHIHSLHITAHRILFVVIVLFIILDAGLLSYIAIKV